MRRSRYQKLVDIRNDSQIHRYHRIVAAYNANRSEIDRIAKSDPELAKYQARFVSLMGRIRHDLKDSSRPRFAGWPWSIKSWAKYHDDFTKYHAVLREVSHLVHELHVMTVRVMPPDHIEESIQFSLEDLRVISPVWLYDKFKISLAEFTGDSQFTARQSAGMSAGSAISAPGGSSRSRSASMSTKMIALLNETRRQSLALAQLEVMRDAVTRELLVAGARLAIPIALLLVLSNYYFFRLADPGLINAGLLAPIGGIAGATLSAFVRISRMQENLDVSRAMSLLAGASRSIYFAPMIGALSAFCLFIVVSSGIELGFLEFDWQKSGQSSLRSSSETTKDYLAKAFTLGLIAGFSERLVHDLVDRFNKSSSKS
jgi:hypothetical protein